MLYMLFLVVFILHTTLTENGLHMEFVTDEQVNPMSYRVILYILDNFKTIQ